MGFTLDFTHGPDAFFDSVGNLPDEALGTLTDGLNDVVDGVGDTLEKLLSKLGMPLMILGGGLLVFMLIKK